MKLGFLYEGSKTVWPVEALGYSDYYDSKTDFLNYLLSFDYDKYFPSYVEKDLKDNILPYLTIDDIDKYISKVGPITHNKHLRSPFGDEVEIYFVSLV